MQLHKSHEEVFRRQVGTFSRELQEIQQPWQNTVECHVFETTTKVVQSRKDSVAIIRLDLLHAQGDDLRRGNSRIELVAVDVRRSFCALLDEDLAPDLADLFTLGDRISASQQ